MNLEKSNSLWIIPVNIDIGNHCVILIKTNYLNYYYFKYGGFNLLNMYFVLKQTEVSDSLVVIL